MFPSDLARDGYPVRSPPRTSSSGPGETAQPRGAVQISRRKHPNSSTLSPALGEVVGRTPERATPPTSRPHPALGSARAAAAPTSFPRPPGPSHLRDVTAGLRTGMRRRTLMTHSAFAILVKAIPYRLLIQFKVNNHFSLVFIKGSFIEVYSCYSVHSMGNQDGWIEALV
jgi:hypothetical protein